MPGHFLARDKIRNSLGQLAEGVLSLVYPPQCAACLKCEQAQSCRFLCEDCLARVIRAEIPAVRWWQNVEEGHSGGGRACECDLAAWFYEDSMMALIPRMKYQNRPAIARVFAEIAVARLGELINAVLSSAEKVAPVLVPVPLHSRRQRERGYNQSWLIARAFSKGWKFEMWPRALRRTRFTRPQARLNATERAKNVRDAFTPACVEKIAGRTVFLVDDVITTGATVSSCARTLRQAGAAQVLAVALARTGRDLMLKG